MSQDAHRLAGCGVQRWIIYRLDSVQFLIFFGTQASGPCTSLIIIILSMTSPPCKKTKHSMLSFHGHDCKLLPVQSTSAYDSVHQEGFLAQGNSGDLLSSYIKNGPDTTDRDLTPFKRYNSVASLLCTAYCSHQANIEIQLS